MKKRADGRYMKQITINGKAKSDSKGLLFLEVHGMKRIYEI